MIITSAMQCYSSRRLQEEFKAHFKHSAPILNPLQINSNKWFNYTSDLPTLIRSTGMNYDDSDLFLAQTFNTPMIQQPKELLIFRDKLRQYLWMRERKIPTLPTEYNYDCTTNFSQGPFIVKSRRGMKGLGVTYIENRKSLLSLLKTLRSINDQQFIVQPFVAATEFRIFVIAKKVHSVLCKDKQLAITANANSQVPTTLVTNFSSIHVETIIDQLDSHYFAIDLLRDNRGNEYILEINMAPGFEQLEKITGDNIASRLWKKNF